MSATTVDVTITKRTRIWIRIASDQILESNKTNTKRRFQASSITIAIYQRDGSPTGNIEVTVHGPVIKKNGEPGDIGADRLYVPFLFTAHTPLTEMPEWLRLIVIRQLESNGFNSDLLLPERAA